MDRNLRPVSRVLALALFPFALAVLAPLALVIAVLLYAGGLGHAAWHAVAALRRRPVLANDLPLQRPHFLDVTGASVERPRPKC